MRVRRDYPTIATPEPPFAGPATGKPNPPPHQPPLTFAGAARRRTALAPAPEQPTHRRDPAAEHEARDRRADEDVLLVRAQLAAPVGDDGHLLRAASRPPCRARPGWPRSSGGSPRGSVRRPSGLDLRGGGAGVLGLGARDGLADQLGLLDGHDGRRRHRLLDRAEREQAADRAEQEQDQRGDQEAEPRAVARAEDLPDAPRQRRAAGRSGRRGRRCRRSRPRRCRGSASRPSRSARPCASAISSRTRSWTFSVTS